ncbi:MAG: Phage terminase large subunit (GpA) [Syntrophaceae bacterium PtaB.Bin038]|nr:MAG: Phage terminase large subunit (GpA) [Syntrophaceae bacterium PtaB.Bin038]
MARAARKLDVQGDTPARLRAVDAWYWAYNNAIRLTSGPFAHEAHEYLAEPLRDMHPNQVAMKGSQMGWTEKSVLKTLHGMIHRRYPQGVLHLFPTADDVGDFSKARFNPLIENNPEHVGRYVRSTDAANIKKIGSAMLYLRGARATQKIEGLAATSSKLKSIPVDRIAFDEYDEMDPAMVALALERVAHSKIKEFEKLSTPTVPDYGIDAAYKASDRHVWAIRCDRCQHDTVLELEFPKCLRRRQDGTAYRACIRCGGEIHPRAGRWVAMSPSVKDCRGWWISQLCSMYVDPTAILNEYERISEAPPGERQVFYNSKLATAYVDAANRLSPQDVYRCIGRDAMETRHDGPCAMGVDVGTFLHVVVGYKPQAGCLKICHVARLREWNELHDLALRFRVDCAVIDREPEIHKAREFRQAERFQVFLADYQEHQRGDARWDLDQGLVVMNRTELLDRVHTAVTTPGQLEIPRLTSEIEQYATEMSNLVKVLVEKPNGSRLYEYKQVGPDHYRHATAYFLLAAERIPVAAPAGLPWMQRSMTHAIMDEDPLGHGRMPSPAAGGYSRAVTDYNPFGR